eukprot:9688299-Ditylum_brightwellii.AAC.1
MDIITNSGAPFPLQQILAVAYDAMYYMGLYNEKCLQWEDKPPNEKTWLAWKAFFIKVVHDHHCLHKAVGMNYQVNSAVQVIIQQDAIYALANLASATVDDRNAVANLTASNSKLAAQIKALSEHKVHQKEEMETLKNSVSDILLLLQDTNLHSNNNCNQNNQQNQHYQNR